MPLLRYRTRDLTRVLPGPCPCGRAHRRIARLKGRTDDMFIIKGVNIFPIQVEQVLLRLLGVGSNFRIELDREGDRDDMKVLVEVTGDIWHGDVKELRGLQRHVREELRSEILVSPLVELVEPGALPQSEGKAVRVVVHGTMWVISVRGLNMAQQINVFAQDKPGRLEHLTRILKDFGSEHPGHHPGGPGRFRGDQAAGGRSRQGLPGT